MKKTLIMAGLLAVSLPISSALADYTEERDVDAFSSVSVDGMMDVTIEVGEEQSVSITTNKQRYLDDITTSVRDGKLFIDFDLDRNFFSLFKNIDIEVHITVPSLEGIELNGLGDFEIHNVNSENFRAELDGMGSIDIDGTCDSATFIIDGLGDLNARGFECKSVRLVMDGMGDADIYASEYADIDLDGMGDVDIYGNPARTKLREDGMGDIDVK